MQRHRSTGKPAQHFGMVKMVHGGTGVHKTGRGQTGGKNKNNHPFLAGKISWAFFNNDGEIII